ncbi:coiled-coil domain-containing protein SCD2-like isoform X1 [Andrographis paniculata]|nr:coiled-coil domain-containing protein SCD2-like isoform X1 [Andrographis paniculata]
MPSTKSSAPVNSVEQQRPISGVRTSASEQKPSSSVPVPSVRPSQSKPLEPSPSLHPAVAGRLSQSKSAEPSPSLHPAVPGQSSQFPDYTEEEELSLRSTSSARASAAVNSEHQPSSFSRKPSFLQAPSSKPVEPSPSLHSSVAGRLFQSLDSAEEAQPTSGHNNVLGRSSSNSSLSEQPSSARSIGRPSLKIKTASGGPSVPLPNKLGPSLNSSESLRDRNRLSLDLGTLKYKEPVGSQQSSSALQDELDMLQEENESLLEKLRIAEERCEEAESRTRQLEKQIASLGEGVSLEARLLSRKEAQLQKREAALRVASVNYGGGVDEIVALRMEAEAAKEETKSLRTMTQRMILAQDEMEEVVLKRCWLARCWGLCVRHGIHAEIAEARFDYWSSSASRPVEVILAIGRKAKDENSISNDLEERENILDNKDEVSKRATVEHMLLVEKGLRELNSLKVEEALALSMAEEHRQSVVKSNATDDVRLPSEGYDYSEAFELNQEESEDVHCKQALLIFFWRRAKNLGLESDIADDRLQYWINQGDKTLNSQDAVEVERGLMELRKLGLETKLWEEARRLVDPDSAEKTLLETEYQILEA